MTGITVHRVIVGLSTAALCVGASFVGGCAAFYLGGAMAQTFEYQKKIEVPAKYPYLAGKKVAVIADADLGLLYQHPDLVQKVASGVTLRIGRDVPEVKLLNPNTIVSWQWSTPQWNAMTYGEMAEALEVDRVVYIDISEYRLNPPGNQWLWEGVCAASVGIIERDGFDPDSFAETFEISSTFPQLEAVDRPSATASQIEMGVLQLFVERTAWLFHDHIEPKYPDKYRPELDQ